MKRKGEEKGYIREEGEKERGGRPQPPHSIPPSATSLSANSLLALPYFIYYLTAYPRSPS